MTTVSVRSFLAAGLAAATVGSATMTPSQDLGATPTAVIASPQIQLSAALQPLIQPVGVPAATTTPTATEPQASAIGAGSAGDVIINVYNYVEPWVAWGFELAQWALSFVPGLWWVAPGIDMAYFTVEPLVQSLVYSFAYLIDRQPSLIGPTIRSGIQQSASNFVQYGIYWIESIVPFPPLPPFPIFPFASVPAASVQMASVVPPIAARAARRAAAATATTAPAAPDEAVPADEPVTATDAPAKARVARNPLRAATRRTSPAADNGPAARTVESSPVSADTAAAAPTTPAGKSPTRNAAAAGHEVKAARSVARAG